MPRLPGAPASRVTDRSGSRLHLRETVAGSGEFEGFLRLAPLAQDFACRLPLRSRRQNGSTHTLPPSSFRNFRYANDEMAQL
jgi:hypothetical protein